MTRPPLARPLAVIVALLATALALGGCISKESAPTRFYVLESLPAGTAPLAEARREPPLSVDLAALRLPQYLERPQIVTRTAPGRLELDEYRQWGGNLAKNMLRVMARNLSLLLGSGDISVFSRRPVGPLDGRVDIEVLQFERGPDDRVVLSAQWWLQSGADGARPVSRVSDLASELLPGDAGTDATVAEMSALLGRLSVEIARAVAAGARP